MIASSKQSTAYLEYEGGLKNEWLQGLVMKKNFEIAYKEPSQMFSYFVLQYCEFISLKLASRRETTCMWKMIVLSQTESTKDSGNLYTAANKNAGKAITLFIYKKETLLLFRNLAARHPPSSFRPSLL
jgi:hypothetical protein